MKLVKYFTLLIPSIYSFPNKFCNFDEILSYNRQNSRSVRSLNNKLATTKSRKKLQGDISTWDNAALRPIKWKLKTTNIPRTTYPDGLTPFQEIKNNLEIAFNLWGNRSNINFMYVDSHAGSEISISFEKRKHHCNLAFLGPGGAVAHAFPPGYRDFYNSLDGDLHFDIDENWEWKIKALKYMEEYDYLEWIEYTNGRYRYPDELGNYYKINEFGEKDMRSSAHRMMPNLKSSSSSKTKIQEEEFGKKSRKRRSDRTKFYRFRRPINYHPRLVNANSEKLLINKNSPETYNSANSNWIKSNSLEPTQSVNSEINPSLINSFANLQSNINNPYNKFYRRGLLKKEVIPNPNKVPGLPFITSYENTTTINMMYTAIHEVGHTLGLIHSSSNKSIMFAFIDQSEFIKIFDPIDPKIPEIDHKKLIRMYGKRPGSEKLPNLGSAQSPTWPGDSGHTNSKSNGFNISSIFTPVVISGLVSVWIIVILVIIGCKIYKNKNDKMTAGHAVVT